MWIKKNKNIGRANTETGSKDNGSKPNKSDDDGDVNMGRIQNITDKITGFEDKLNNVLAGFHGLGLREC